MEYIKGQTLNNQLRSKGLRTGEVLGYAVQITDALATAHRAGILHRDLKPSNIMVTDEGRIKILDFGLAKLLEPIKSTSDGSTVTAGPLTEQGVLLGTTAYMSPEQVEGRKLDERSDIFSFGSTLYEMVTGRKPFNADSQFALLTKIMNEEPTPPSQFAGSIPPELEKIILALSKEGSDPAVPDNGRPESGARGSAGGARFEETGARDVATSPSSLAPVVIAACFFAWRELRRTPPPEPLRAAALTTFPGEERYPSFSPDGNRVAFTWTGTKQDNTDVYAQQIGAGSPLRLTTHPFVDYNPVWSPNGRWIAFLRSESSSSVVGKSELRLVPPLGGPERKLAEVRVREVNISPGDLDWCPDETCLVVTDSPSEEEPDSLFVVSLETGEKRRLTNPPPGARRQHPSGLSPDGRSLVFRRNIAGRTGELYWLPLTKDQTVGGEPNRLTLATLNATQPAWMPNGEEILFSARGSLWRMAVRGDRPPTRLPFVGEDGAMPVVYGAQPAGTARLVYVRSFSDLNIWRIQTSAAGVPSPSPPAASISSTREDSNDSCLPTPAGLPLHRIALADSKSGWPILMGPMPSSSLPWTPKSQAPPAGPRRPNDRV